MADIERHPASYKVLISGSRFLDHDKHSTVILDTIKEMVKELGIQSTDSVTAIAGDAKGADTIACALIALYFPDWQIKRYKAEWSRHGKAAGPIRNLQMIEDNEPNVLLAFPKGDSPGTRDAIRTFDKLTKKVLYKRVQEMIDSSEDSSPSKVPRPISPMLKMDENELGLSLDKTKRQKIAESDDVSTEELTDHLLDQALIEATDSAEKAKIHNPLNTLDPKQQLVIDAVKKGKSVFFSGPAGTGKSCLLKIIRDDCVKKHGFAAVYVTASTGTAACLLGGVTINSYAGVGFATESIPVLIGKVRNNFEASLRIAMTKVLIIDEISMISAELFNKLNEIFKCVRNNYEAPFGGIQLVVCGDFYQLPPVNKLDPDASDDDFPVVNTFGDDDSDDDDDDEEVDQKYSFQSAVWKQLFPEHQNCYLLTKIFRQGDQTFVNILNNIRIGQLDTMQYAALLKCVGRNFDNSATIPTHLYPLRETVNQYNTSKMAEIKQPVHSFRSTDTLEKSKYLSLLNTNCVVPATLNLKVGARVMYVRNRFDLGLVNGSQGVVTGFVYVEERAMASNGTLIIKNVECPVVKFDNGIEVTVRRDQWKVFSGDKLVATREQVPLILAWAITIHKSQGMTLEYLEVDIKDVFADGQTYVALSRVKSLKGLRLKSYFPLTAIRTNSNVFRYYKQMEKGILLRK